MIYDGDYSSYYLSVNEDNILNEPTHTNLANYVSHYSLHMALTSDSVKGCPMRLRVGG